MLRPRPPSDTQQILQLLFQRTTASLFTLVSLAFLLCTPWIVVSITNELGTVLKTIFLTSYILFSPAVYVFCCALFFLPEIAAKPSWKNLVCPRTLGLWVGLFFTTLAVFWGINMANDYELENSVVNTPFMAYVSLSLAFYTLCVLWSLGNTVFITETYFSLLKESKGIVNISKPTVLMVHRYFPVYIFIATLDFLVMVSTVYVAIKPMLIFAILPCITSLLISALLAYDAGARCRQSKSVVFS